MVMIMGVFDHFVGLAHKGLKKVNLRKDLNSKSCKFCCSSKNPSISTGVFKTLSNN